MKKDAIYDVVTKDWAMYLNDEFIGARPTEAAAWAELDRQALAMLKHQQNNTL